MQKSVQMKNIKSILLYTLVSLFCITTYAQEKEIDASSRKAPKWHQSALEDYIISYGEGENIAEAKERALINLRADIVKSVASYVKSSSEMTMENVSKNHVVSTTQVFKNKSSVISANIPSLKGVSLNKAEESYWVKFRDKETNKERVEFHVLYPFTKSELQKLIREFNEQDEKMTNDMNAAISEINSAKTIEALIDLMKQLEAFEDYFIDSRQQTAKIEKEKVAAMIKNVVIVPIQQKVNQIEYALKIGDKAYGTSQRPIVKSSECIKASSQSNGNKQLIDFTQKYCYEGDENSVSVQYRYLNKKVEQSFKINIHADDAEIYLKDAITLYIADEAKCEMTIYAKYSTPFTINQLELEFPDQGVLLFKNVSQSFEGEGAHQLTATTEVNPNVMEAGTINGTILFTVDTTGEQKRYKIMRQKARVF